MGEPSTKLAPGLTLGPFVLAEKLALGGMAEIWSADEGDRRVALKILLPLFSKDQSFRAMFQDEVDIATKLTHANIVEVYGAHEIDGFVFQSMELLDGRDLRRVLSGLARAGRWFPVRFALYVGFHMARALAHAHARRGADGRSLEIVHRDVSPHNVMIALDGRVKVLDFGIARAAERLARTRPGVVKGKIPYMAPEQALAVGVTPQTDIFAAGVVLWEMLAMRRLFRGDSDPELLRQVVRAEIPPLHEQNEKVPTDVAQLIHKMLEQRAANRPASMHEVENELHRMVARHFGEVTQADLARWAAPYLEENKRAPTMALPVAGPDEPEGDPTEPTPEIGVITEPTPAPEPDALSAAAQDAFQEAMAGWESPEDPVTGADETLAMPNLDALPEADESEDEAPSTASGPTVAMPSVTLPSFVSPEQAERAASPSERSRVRGPRPSGPHEPSNGTPTPTPATGDPSDDAATAHVRMPTRSEIIRAVESVATMPVRADPALLAGIEQRVQVSTAPRTLSEERPSVERAPAPPGAVTATMQGQDAVITQSSPPVRVSVLPLVAVGLALLAVIVLALLVLAD